jgi:hypothetical protein
MSAPRFRPLTILAGVIPLLLWVNCSGEIGTSSGAPMPGPGSGGSGGPSHVPGEEIGTVDIANARDKVISRLTNAQFIHSAAALFGEAAVVGAEQLMKAEEGHGSFRNAGYAQLQVLDTILGFDKAATFIVEHVTDWPAFHQRWGGCTQASCINTFIRNFTEAAFRRPPSDVEIQAFKPILDASATEALTYDETVKLIGRATLQSPHLLYLWADDALDDLQLASRLSYFLTDGPPDAALYAVAKAQTLRKAGELDKQIDRLLTTSLSRFGAAFAYDYLDLSSALIRNIPAAMVNPLISSAVDSFAALVDQNQPISSILTLNTFVTNDATATWILGQPSTAKTVQPNPKYPFMGIVTHPATLMAMSNATLGSTVSRGLYVASDLLCIPPAPAPPAGIQATDLSALLPPDPTARDFGEARMARPDCRGCHAQFETYSFAFNKWGGDGLFKDDPRLKDNGPVETGLGNISFGGYTEFLTKVSKSTQFRRCVADHVIRYGLQHTEYPPELVQTVLADASKAPELTFRSLMKALARQPIFTTR